MTIRSIFSVPVFLCLFSCSNKPNQIDFEEALGGQWVLIGQYQMGELVYDTLESSISTDFGVSERESRTFTLSTDSGVFVHTYSEEGLEIARKSESSITEFVFDSDTSGVAFDYEMDLKMSYAEHPRIYAATERFWLKSGVAPGSFRISFEYPNKQGYGLGIISDDSLKVISEEGEFSLYVRVRKP